MANLGFPEANKILRASLLDVGYTRVTTGILRLYKNSTLPDEQGVGGTEIGAGHVGKSFTWNGTNFTVTGLTATNAVAIQGDNNGNAAVTATGFAIFRPDGTSLMFRGALVAPIEVANGAPFNVPIGALDFALSGAFADGWGNDWLDHIVTGAAITLPDSDVELDLVSTEPTASSAGTTVVGTGYAPLALNVGAGIWTVTDNVAELQAGLTPSFAVMGNQWTNPRGVNMYRSSTAGLRMFFDDWGAAISTSPGNQLIFDADLDANTIRVTLT